jgi:hypothetical protein
MEGSASGTLGWTLSHLDSAFTKNEAITTLQSALTDHYQNKGSTTSFSLKSAPASTKSHNPFRIRT